MTWPFIWKTPQVPCPGCSERDKSLSYMATQLDGAKSHSKDLAAKYEVLCKSLGHAETQTEALARKLSAAEQRIQSLEAQLERAKEDAQEERVNAKDIGQMSCAMVLSLEKIKGDVLAISSFIDEYVDATFDNLMKLETLKLNLKKSIPDSTGGYI